MDADDLVAQILSSGSLSGGEPRTGHYTGTKALMMAVLVEGIRDCCSRPGRLRDDAEQWVRSNRRSAFSFSVICEVLGLEPNAVRRALPRLQKQSTPRRLRPSTRYRLAPRQSG